MIPTLFYLNEREKYMIIDTLDNIDKYSEIPVYAVEFVKKLTSDIELGKYKLNENEFVNIEEYQPKTIADAKFEYHKKYVDIQILLSGTERIYIRPVNGLTEAVKYSEEKDIAFISESVENADFVTLNGTNFVMIYPHEAHAPQVEVSNFKDKVKKVVVKLLVK